jgi:hypothetical protein
LESCLLFILLVVLCLLLIHGSSIAGLHASASAASLKGAVRWWLFFVIKSSLLVFASLIVSIELVSRLVVDFPIDAEQYGGGIFMWLLTVLSTLALSWSIRDQAGRCRACLKRMGIRITMGMSVGPFGEPSGSNLVCEGGHGVLHVPALASTCLDSEKWTNIDESWREVLHSA